MIDLIVGVGLIAGVLIGLWLSFIVVKNIIFHSPDSSVPAYKRRPVFPKSDLMEQATASQNAVPKQSSKGLFGIRRKRKLLTIYDLAERLGISRDELKAFRPSYREASIPKRSGKRRLLSIPDDSTKAMQRRIVRRLLSLLESHSAATGFEKGKSIVDNARIHVQQDVVVKLDVVDFFPTTAKWRVEAFFRRLGWDRKAAAWLANATTFKKGLPQGAPSSPRLSNLVNVHLDRRLASLADHLGARYSRYADDITFSFGRTNLPKTDRVIRSKSLHQRIKLALSTTDFVLRFYGYQLHRRAKRSVNRRHRRQQVTGLVVNEKVAVPRSKRRWLRAVEHRLNTKGEASLTAEQLQGWKAFIAMVNGMPVAERVEMQPELTPQPETNLENSTGRGTNENDELATELSRIKTLSSDEYGTAATREWTTRCVVDGADQPLPFDAPTELKSGRRIVVQLDNLDQKLELWSGANQAETIRHLMRGDLIAVRLRFHHWDLTFDRPVMVAESIDR